MHFVLVLAILVFIAFGVVANRIHRHRSSSEATETRSARPVTVVVFTKKNRPRRLDAELGEHGLDLVERPVNARSLAHSRRVRVTNDAELELVIERCMAGKPARRMWHGCYEQLVADVGADSR